MTTKEGEQIVHRIRDEILLQSRVYFPIVEEIIKTKVDQAAYTIGSKDATIYLYLVCEEDIEATTLS